MSLENMMAVQPPDQGTGHDETQDAMFPKVEETASKKDESEVKAIDEDSVDADLDLSSRRSKMVKAIDEDSVDDDLDLSSRRSKMIILSDDEDSNPQSESGTSHLMEDKDRTAQRKMTVIGSDSESDEDGILFYKKPNTEKPTKTVYNRDIFDTELSDEDQPLQSEERSHSPPDLQESEMAAPPKDKKKVKKARKSSVKAQQEIQSIHSETQRMVRESRISLPYRRPKQRTLAEFLARRKQTSIAPSIKNQTLKMTMRNMECIRLLEEKKKRVDELYNENSDSDSEDADDRDWHSGQKDDPSGKDETLDSPTVTEESVGEVILPDLTAPFNESSVQEENSQKNCFESHTFTSEDEGLGLGASEENTVREHSSPADISQFGGIASTNNIENGMPVTEQINSEDKLLENVGIKTGINTESSDNEEEGMSEELQTPSAEERRHLSTSNSTDTSKLTPKLKFLSSILPEERLKKIMSITPKLNSGKKADFIDLEERSPLQDSGICEFKDRFMRQTSMKEKPEDKQQLSLNLVSEQDDDAEGQRQVSSSLLNTVDAKQDQVTKEGVPGSQFTSFKAALQAKIREQREIHRVRRLQEKQFMETEEIPEDYQNDIFPDEEAELTDKSETDYETESEPEENDVVITDHKREKSCYVDDEADEDEDGEETENNDAEQEAGPASDSDDENDTIEATKERKRIIQDPDDDSEEEEHESLTFDWDETQGGQSQPAAHTEDLSASFTYKRGDTLDKDASITSFDSSFELYGSVIAGHQPRGGMKVNAENGLSQFLTKNKSSSFSSTLSTSSKKQQELSLPAEDSADIFNNEGTSASEGVLDLNFSSLDSTQPHESNKENESFSKLHLDLGRIDGTQDKDELIGLCSGQFSDETEAATEVRELCGDGVTPTQTINELLGLCSGRFGGAKQGESSRQKNSLGGPQTLPVSQDDHDEDELLGLCTAKFTVSNSQTELDAEESEAEKTETENLTGASPKMVIYSSEDDDSMDITSVRRKKRKRVIEFSDDEDAQEPIAFDEEENEIPTTVFTGFKDNSKRGIRAEFLENEAELSGSDVNSDDDEGEGSADDMEEEEGDREYFDNNELRDQVGKAHLRSLLDSDKREVRLLQEMYLEDGELHGEGRTRQFRWKNLDRSMIEDERKAFSDEEEGSDDNGDDGEWRKQKAEREKFLQEQRGKLAETDLYEVESWPSVQKLPKEDSGSGHRKPLAPVAPVQVATKVGTNFNIFLKKQRGSFLNRDRSTLARIAEFTRDRRDVVGGAKQRGNFVFQQISGDDLQDKVEEEEKSGVSQRRRDSLPAVKKAKMDQFSSSRDNNHPSSSIFKHL